MLKIISMLWSSVYDLLFLVKGQGIKTLEQIEKDLDIIEMRCRPYADIDDVEETQGREEVTCYGHCRNPENRRRCIGCNSHACRNYSSENQPVEDDCTVDRESAQC